MSQRIQKPIFGLAPLPLCNETEGEAYCDTQLMIALEDFMIFIRKTEEVISNFFPATKAIASAVGKMGYTASLTVPPMFMVWFKWREIYPDEKIDVTDDDVLNRLKDLYLEMGVPWELDPFLNPPPQEKEEC